jgi:2'-5' RNA ligase
MKAPSTAIPGYRIMEYRVVLHPHEDLRDRIKKLRQAFGEKYNVPVFQQSGTALLLASFIQYELKEERIVQKLKSVSMGFHPVMINLKDFGSFPSHTLYINVTSKLPVQELVKAIRSEAQLLMKFDKDNKPHFILEPHITIASRLQPWQYEKGWNEYSHRHFTGHFIADGMLLLKRPLNTKAFQIVQRFQFENLLVSTKQGDLFGT